MPFELRIEFSGLCLFVVSGDKRRVGVLMPDARRKPSLTTMRHIDGTVAVPHVGYLRFDFGDVDASVPTGVTSGAGPRYEVVHRFDRETLDLGLGSEQGAVGIDELLFPDFRAIDHRFTLLPGLFGETPPEQLLMRTVLTGGSFTSHSRGSNWTFPTIGAHAGGPYQGQFANFAVWTRTIHDDSMTISITPFRNERAIPFRLRPRDGIVQLKIANLCAKNPLEWPELCLRKITGDEDLDFKWLYRLMNSVEPTPSGLNGELPVPVLDRTSGVASEDWDCTGGTINGDI